MNVGNLREHYSILVLMCLLVNLCILVCNSHYTSNHGVFDGKFTMEITIHRLLTIVKRCPVSTCRSTFEFYKVIYQISDSHDVGLICYIAGLFLT